MQKHIVSQNGAKTPDAIGHGVYFAQVAWPIPFFLPKWGDSAPVGGDASSNDFD